jgi:hypothetical protein
MVKIVLFSFMASILIADVLPFVKQIKWFLDAERLKPFDCALCLSFWIALVTTFYNQGITFNLIFIPVCSMFVMYLFKTFQMY